MKLLCHSASCRRVVGTAERRGDRLVYKTKTREAHDGPAPDAWPKGVSPPRWTRYRAGIVDAATPAAGRCTRCRQPWTAGYDAIAEALAGRRSAIVTHAP